MTTDDVWKDLFSRVSIDDRRLNTATNTPMRLATVSLDRSSKTAASRMAKGYPFRPANPVARIDRNRSNEPSLYDDQHQEHQRSRQCSNLYFFRTRKLPTINPQAKPFQSTEGNGGARRDRTDDLKLAKLPLSQLSYGPKVFECTANRRQRHTLPDQLRSN